MAKLQRRPLTRADEVRSYAHGKVDVFDMGDFIVTRFTNEPGWRWSTSVKPSAGTDFCQFHHHGYTVSGRLHVEMVDGAEMEIGPGEIYEIPSGHDAWVAGDEPWVSIDWAPRARTLEQQPRAPSARWRPSCSPISSIPQPSPGASATTAGRTSSGEHNRVVRDQLARFGGREVDTTGDGFLCMFDVAEAAVRAGLSIVAAVRAFDVQVRVGVHTGEVELEGDNVRGLAVHVASRILGLAGPSEVLVSWTTHALLSGTDIGCEHRGAHELKGLEGPRAVYQAHSP